MLIKTNNGCLKVFRNLKNLKLFLFLSLKVVADSNLEFVRAEN